MRKALASVWALMLVACATSRQAESVTAGVELVQVEGGGDEAVVFAVPFIQDDYPRALAEAKARKLPIFVDAWVSW